MQHSKNIGVVLLAAGAASRMGQPKQLLKWKGKTLLQHALETGLEYAPGALLVVTGAFTEDLTPVIRQFPGVYSIHNPNWDKGMGTTIAAGVKGLLAEQPFLDGILILLADQPLVQSKQLDTLIQVWQQNQVAYAAAYYSGKMGVPALFSNLLFDALCTLEGQVGAKHILQTYKAAGVSVPMPEAACDVDTPEEWIRFLKENS